MKKLDFFLITIILFIALILRLYKLNIPIADLHSWRQADTAAVARNFTRNGFDLLHPRFDDLSNVQSGFENPQGYRMVEFPLYNALMAYGYKLFPSLSLEAWGRLISIFFSLIAIAIIYYLVLKEKSRLAAFFSGFIYAIMPFFVFFSRVVIPESTAIGLSLLAILFLYKSDPKYVIHYKLYFILSLLFFSLALLVKPTTIFFTIPLFYLFFKNFKLKTFRNPAFYLYFLISTIPLILWRFYIKTYPEGIPVNEWLLTSVNSGGGLQKIFLKPSFFRWIFFERINNLIFGGYLTVLFVLGIIGKQKRFFFYSLLFSSLIYILVFQGGNVQHEYYQVLLFPTLAIFTGLGIDLLFQKKALINFELSFIVVPLLIILSWYFSYTKVKDYYQYSQELIQEAKVLNNLTRPEDKIVTDRMGDTTLLYLADRKGAPAIYKEPHHLKSVGYKFLITTSKEQINIMKNEFKVVFENDKFTLFEL